MKKIFYVFLILLWMPSIFAGCIGPSKNADGSPDSQIKNANTGNRKFALYLVKNLSTLDAAKMDLNRLQLESEPFISEADISSYYWNSAIFIVDKSVYESKIKNKIEMKESGTPFVVTANGERIYLGTFLPSSSSDLVSEAKNTSVILTLGRNQVIDGLRHDGYNVTPKDNEIYLKLTPPINGKDNRCDDRISKALEEAGLL